MVFLENGGLEMKRCFLILLALCLTMGLFPKGALAAEAYDLWVGGVQVTSDNLTIDSSDSSEITGGSAVFDPVTHTLTLNSFTCSGGGYAFQSDAAAAIYSALDTLNLTTVHASHLKHNAANLTSYGIYTTGHLVITGESSGTLIAESSNTDTRSIGIYLRNGNLTLNGGHLVGKSGNAAADDVSTGIWCFHGDVTVNAQGELAGYGGKANISRGLCVSGILTVNGGIATGIGGTAGLISHGISTGSLQSNHEQSHLTGTSANAEESIGILLWNPSSFSGGFMEGTSNATLSQSSHGISAMSDLTLGGGLTAAKGLTGAFTKPPSIDPDFYEAGIWYGETEASAKASGARPIRLLASNFAQSYVCIAPAFSAVTALPEIPHTGDPSAYGLVLSLFLFSFSGLILLFWQSKRSC